MKKILIIWSAIITVAIGVILITNIATAQKTEVLVDPTLLTLDEQIVYFTNKYGGDIEINRKVIECESNGKVTVVGDSGRSVGIAQFQKPTFLWMEKEFGEDLNYMSSFDQLKLFTWAMSKGYGNNWTAYRAIKNGGTYSFFSKQLNKHFKVTCR